LNHPTGLKRRCEDKCPICFIGACKKNFSRRFAQNERRFNQRKESELTSLPPFSDRCYPRKSAAQISFLQVALQLVGDLESAALEEFQVRDFDPDKLKVYRTCKLKFVGLEHTRQFLEVINKPSILEPSSFIVWSAKNRGGMNGSHDIGSKG
jgi:hypothetical protein